jgi:hypothetical protein
MGSSTIVFPAVTDPPTLEALAFREDHALVDDMYICKVQIASDCKQVINDIAEAAGGSYAPIIKEIGMH